MSAKRLQAIIRKTRRRLRLQQVLERTTTCVAVSLAAVVVLLFLYKTRTLGFDSLLLGVAGSGSLLLAGALWGLLTPIRDRAVLKRLDLSHTTRDALGSSQDFLDRLARNPEDAHRELMEAQLRQTARLLATIDPRRASRFRRPRDLSAVGVLTLSLVAFLAMGVPARQSARAYVQPVQKIPGLQIDPAYYEELNRDIHKLLKLAQGMNDPQLSAFLKEYQQLLDALKRGDLTRREFEQRHQALLGRHFPGIQKEQDQLKALAKQLAKAAEPLQKDRLTKALAQALKRHDLDAAKQALDQMKAPLANQKLSPAQRKRIAEALQKAAQKLDQLRKAAAKKDQQRDQALDNQQKKAQQKLRQLQRRLSQAKDQATRERLKRQFQKQQRQLDRLQRQVQRLARQRRSLQRLSRSLKQFANALAKQKLDAETLKLLQKLQAQLGRYQNQQQRGSARQQAMMSAQQLKEMLKRMLKNRPGKGQLSDYLKKAWGQNRPGCKSCGKPGGCKSCGRPGNGTGLRPGLRPGSGGVPLPGGKMAGQPGGKPGGKPGTAHNPGNVHGRPKSIDAGHVDRKVPGQHGSGPSEVNVYQGSASKGFSSHSYRKVYLAYRKIRQAVLNQEQVPPGYRDRIQRYFWLIRPR
ncbi:MAG: hypothetical protein ABI333_20855 [bacterium]